MTTDGFTTHPAGCLVRCGGWGALRSFGAAVVVLIGAAASLGAQQLFDPADRIYRHLAIWEQRGYVSPLPELRPFAPQLVVELLRQVVAVGDRRDSELAESYLMALSPDAEGDSPVLPPFHTSVRADLSSVPEDAVQDAPRTRITAEIAPIYVTEGLLAYSAAFQAWWQNGHEPLLRHTVPRVPANELTVPYDTNGAGVAVDVRAAAAFGVPGLHLQAGFVQHEFGSALQDSVVLAAGAPAAAQFSAVYRGEAFTYTAAFLELVAQQAATRAGYRYDLKSGCPDDRHDCPVSYQGFPSKYLMLHALQWHPLPWLSATAFSTKLFGGRISLYQLLPTASIIEPYTLNYDNGFLGGSMRFRLPAATSAAVTLFIDDLFYSRNDGIRLFGNKMAGQAAVSWAPSWLRGMVSVDYLFLTPYMYTHSSHQTLHYLTYTHRGQPLGSRLPPNSDQWTLAGFLTPAEWLDLELAARAIRHGNASDPTQRLFPGPYDDGSIWDDGYDSNEKVTFYGAPNFLNQPVLERVYQFEVAAAGRVPLPPVELTARMSYGIEYVENLDLIEGATATNHLFGAQVGISF